MGFGVFQILIMLIVLGAFGLGVFAIIASLRSRK